MSQSWSLTNNLLHGQHNCDFLSVCCFEMQKAEATTVSFVYEIYFTKKENYCCILSNLATNNGPLA